MTRRSNKLGMLVFMYVDCTMTTRIFACLLAHFTSVAQMLNPLFMSSAVLLDWMVNKDWSWQQSQLTFATLSDLCPRLSLVAISQHLQSDATFSSCL